ncbi:MAG: sulfatase-like hydrolase/transferase [Actinomycetota bacterium]
MTDEERAAPPYESDELRAWRDDVLVGRRWFDEHGVSFTQHRTGSLACVPSRPTIFTGQYPDVHGVTQTDGLGKRADDSRMRWLRAGEVPTLGHWLRAAGYDTQYDGKWHITHADLLDPDTGDALATNDAHGVVDPEAVQAYLDADPLDPFGFSGWVGPEPHGAPLANTGVRRDDLIADRVVAWLTDRHERRAAGDAGALRPFLLVASFVNPHDIVMFPAWQRQGAPIEPDDRLDPPDVPAAPTTHEDLSTKPAAQAAFRAAYPSAYGPADIVRGIYDDEDQAYRNLYLRLHAEVDGPLDRVRRAAIDGLASDGRDTVLVHTSDHGDLLGAHGGLHQKWFNLYDEATRVPLTIARTGSRPTGPTRIDAPTSHVDLVPTLLGAIGADIDELTEILRPDFSELHPFPGCDLTPLLDGADADEHRPVYLMTRDNILEGDSGANAMARALDHRGELPDHLRIRVPEGVGANVEGLVVRLSADEDDGRGHRWKLNRFFDDPATWTEPGRRHLDSTDTIEPRHRDTPGPDEWELYDLSVDPTEATNLADAEPDVLNTIRSLLATERARCVPARNEPWPYADRAPTMLGSDTPAESDGPYVPEMLIISGSMRLKQGDRTALIDATTAMVEATLAESGCRAYRFTFDLSDPDLLHVYEEWDDEASLSAHFAEPHFAEFAAVLRDWVAERGSIMRHDVADSKPLG